MSGSVFDLVKGFFDGIRPVPRLSVADWADKYRMLSSVASAEPGPYRTSRTPYLREIMEKLSSHEPTETVVFMKAAQVGATEAGNNWCGYVASISPGPMLMVMPTDETVKRNSKIRIDPMIEATPVLREKIAPARSRDSGNTTMSKNFPGGVLVMTGANSAVGLRSMPVAKLFLDEVDGYPLDLDGEGSPIELAKARTRTFSKRKVFIVSTPTIEGRSAIEREFITTDQRYYQVPCPHCGGMQKLEFEQLKWQKGEPESVRYQCVHCEELIEERFKTDMLANGSWVADHPENYDGKKVGYHINSLYSPLGWYSWGDIVQEWEAAQGDSNKLRTFFNTILGKTWAEQGEAPEWQQLYNRREEYRIGSAPKEVCFITAGVDVQRDRIEIEIVGWGKGKRSWSIDYRVIHGLTAERKVWDELAKVVNEHIATEDGEALPITRMAVDTGYNTQYVYDFCRRFDQTRVIPIKGMPNQGVIISPPRAVDVTTSGKKLGTMRIWPVGVSLVKSELYGYLRLHVDEDGTVPPGYCHFPQYHVEYFKGLTAEQLEFRLVRGFKKFEWVKKYDRNEPLDCRVYARAAAAAVGLDRMSDDHFDQIRRPIQVEQRAGAEKKKRSSFWDR